MLKKTIGRVSVGEYLHKRLDDGKVYTRILVGVHLDSYDKKEKDLLLFKIAEMAEYALDSAHYGLVGVSFESYLYNRNKYLCKLQRFAEAHNLNLEISPIDTSLK